MKKYIWISVVILIMFGCGSRKKSVLKDTAKTETEVNSSGKSSTDIQSAISSETSLSQFLQNNTLKISSNGLPYELQYGNLILKGAADIEFSQKKEKINYVDKYSNYLIYRTITTYKTRTQHNTETTYRSSNTERAGISFGNMIWIVISAMIVGAVLSTWLKSYLPKWRINFLKRE